MPAANTTPAVTLSLGQTPSLVGPGAATPAEMPKHIGRFEIR